MATWKNRGPDRRDRRQQPPDRFGIKLPLYRRNGVSEYIVWRVLDRAIDWFVLRDGEYTHCLPDQTASTAASHCPDYGSTRRRLSKAIWRVSAKLRFKASRVPNTPRWWQNCNGQRQAELDREIADEGRLEQRLARCAPSDSNSSAINSVMTSGAKSSLLGGDGRELTIDGPDL